MVSDESPTNLELICEFLETISDLSKARVSKYRVVLTKISNDLSQPFTTVTRSDLQEYLKRIDARNDYSEWTKLYHRQFAKKFFGWLRDPAFVDWIRLGTVWSKVNYEDLLTEKELAALREACDNLRDRALLETAYESALRPHELLSLKKDSIVFDEYGAYVNLQNGKTGPRRVRIINASPLLADWIANHPVKRKGAALWVDTSNDTSYKSLRLVGLQKLFRRIARKAGISKRVNPYVFRHTRLTHLSKLLTEAVLCEFAGWVQGSEMPRNYVHLSGRDVDEAILRAYGLIRTGDSIKPSVPKACARCTTLNPNGADVCYRCGYALNERVAFRRDEEFQRLKEAVEQIRSQLDKATH